MVNWESKGIKMDGKNINNLKFPNDLVLLSRRKEETEKVENEILRVRRENGLKTYKKKRNT